MAVEREAQAFSSLRAREAAAAAEAADARLRRAGEQASTAGPRLGIGPTAQQRIVLQRVSVVKKRGGGQEGLLVSRKRQSDGLSRDKPAGDAVATADDKSPPGSVPAPPPPAFSLLGAEYGDSDSDSET